MSIQKLSRKLAIAGVQHVVVKAEAEGDYDRIALRKKMLELRTAAKDWHTKPQGINEIQDKCSEISKLLRHIESDSPSSKESKDFAISTLSAISKSLFGGPYPKPTSKEDKAIIDQFKTFYKMEQKYIGDLNQVESVGDFAVAVRSVVDAFNYHLNQYMNTDLD